MCSIVSHNVEMCFRDPSLSVYLDFALYMVNINLRPRKNLQIDINIFSCFLQLNVYLFFTDKCLPTFYAKKFKSIRISICVSLCENTFEFLKTFYIQYALSNYEEKLASDFRREKYVSFLGFTLGVKDR